MEQGQLRYPERSQPSAPCSSLLTPDRLSGFGMTLALSGGARWTQDSHSCPAGSQRCLAAVLHAHQDIGQEVSWNLRQLISSFCRCLQVKANGVPSGYSSHEDSPKSCLMPPTPCGTSCFPVECSTSPQSKEGAGERACQTALHPFPAVLVKCRSPS